MCKKNSFNVVYDNLSTTTTGKKKLSVVSVTGKKKLHTHSTHNKVVDI